MKIFAYGFGAVWALVGGIFGLSYYGAEEAWRLSTIMFLCSLSMVGYMIKALREQKAKDEGDTEDIEKSGN